MDQKTFVTLSAIFVFTSLMVLSMNPITVYANTTNKFVIQNTASSTQDPTPGHESHQIVIALPPRDDGKIYGGTVTYSASKAVEVVVFHPYNASATNEEHGEPLNVPFGDGKVGISLMTQHTGEYNAGSLNFAGSALAFHTRSGEPFSVVYTTAGYLMNATGP
ncbi:MAG: hypothetical protein DA328_08455 [Nitrososphaeraceae archaeon]|nr:hypothetical protein [Nitrososphaeraceae archaeon]